MVELQWPIGNPESACVLRTLSGASLLGIERPPPEPREEIAIVIEEPEKLIGFERFNEHTYELSTARLTVRSLRRLVELALAGNLTAALPLFAPASMTLHETAIGEGLREMRSWLLETKLHPSLVGYLEAQRRSLVSRYDPERAMRVLSLGYLGLEALAEERLTLPVPEPRRSELAAVAAGEVAAERALGELDRLLERFFDRLVVAASDPPMELVAQQWIISVYREHWDVSWRPQGFE